MLDICQYNYYPIWHKYIDTQDGYILDIYRIPGPRPESLTTALGKVTSREPVLMVHGLFGTSLSYILNGPGLAPAFKLADTGRYDVWLLNLRGNEFSRKHNFYDPDITKDYWEFSFEEMGDYDLTTAVSYIL